MSHSYYEGPERVLDAHQFDSFVEDPCSEFYAGSVGRPGLAPDVHSRCLFVGYFEGLNSVRGIAWCVADSFSLRSLLGLAIDKSLSNHSTISRPRRLIVFETHGALMQFVLGVLDSHHLISGKTVGIDASPLEANRAMFSIARRDTKENYQVPFTWLAQESGIATPTHEERERLGRTRKNKASSGDWQNPGDLDAKISVLKSRSTRLAHKAEHAIDRGGAAHGVILPVTDRGASVGGTDTLVDTIVHTTDNRRVIAADEGVAERIHVQPMSALVSD